MNDKEMDFLYEEEKLLDIGSGSRTARYSKPKERREPTFAEIIYDAKFEIKAVGTRAEGKYHHCAFCGCRMKHFIVLRRLSDKALWHVGRRCIGRVGLELPPKVKFIREIGGRWILRILTSELTEKQRRGEVEVKDVPKW